MIAKLTRKAHEQAGQGTVYDVAISPDGQWLASAWGDNRVRLWSMTGGHEAFVLVGHGRAVTSLAFSDRSRLVSGAGAGTGPGEAVYWTKLPGDIHGIVPIEGHGVWSIAVSPVSGLVALGTSSVTDAVMFWQPKSSGPVSSVQEGSRVRSLAFSPDGQSLAHANMGGTAVVWDFDVSRKRFTLRGHKGRITSVAFSPDGSYLATASQDGTVRLWDAETGAARACYDWEMGRLGCVAFAPDGMTIAAGGERDVVVWDVDV
jgi:WD40 repeat protein